MLGNNLTGCFGRLLEDRLSHVRRVGSHVFGVRCGITHGVGGREDHSGSVLNDATLFDGMSRSERIHRCLRINILGTGLSRKRVEEVKQETEIIESDTRAVFHENNKRNE